MAGRNFQQNKAQCEQPSAMPTGFKGKEADIQKEAEIKQELLTTVVPQMALSRTDTARQMSLDIR